MYYVWFRDMMKSSIRNELSDYTYQMLNHIVYNTKFSAEYYNDILCHY